MSPDDVLRIHRQLAPAEDDKPVFRHRAEISIGENPMPDVVECRHEMDMPAATGAAT